MFLHVLSTPMLRTAAMSWFWLRVSFLPYSNIFDVVAILDGTVEKIVEDDSTGKTIEIKHSDNSISIYGSLSEIIVKKGDTVNQGQQIGKSGTNELDKEMGNHLHFEVYNNGQNMNPEVYLNTEQKIKGEE